jgi:hypothetical protein
MDLEGSSCSRIGALFRNFPAGNERNSISIGLFSGWNLNEEFLEPYFYTNHLGMLCAVKYDKRAFENFESKENSREYKPTIKTLPLWLTHKPPLMSFPHRTSSPWTPSSSLQLRRLQTFSRIDVSATLKYWQYVNSLASAAHHRFRLHLFSIRYKFSTSHKRR